MSRHPQAAILHLPHDLNSRAMVCLRAATRLEERGDYSGARESLSLFWEGPGARPNTEGLSEEAAAALLLRAGSLTAWIGSQRQSEGWQAAAKDLLSESADRFARAGNEQGKLEAQKHLGLCYWREGAFDAARAVLNEAYETALAGSELSVSLALDLALVEFSEANYLGCLDVYAEVEWAMDKARDFIRGRFHNGRGIALRNLGETDRAIIELTAAAFHFEQSGHQLYRVPTEINLANALNDALRFSDAHTHLDEADRLSRDLSDSVHLAHARDSRALVYLAETNYEAAAAAARESVAILERGDEQALLVDSLVTLARALSRSRDHEAPGVYVRAFELAAEKIGSERAGRIALELIGEVAGDAIAMGGATLQQVKHEFEASVLRATLAATKTTTEAAFKLGLAQQTLSWMLQNHHPELKPKGARKARAKAIMTRDAAAARKT